MDIAQIIQNVATGSAVTLGLIYIVGGLIVNLNLARRGIVEFQIIKVKYLAAGAIFMMTSASVLLLAFIAGMVIVIYNLLFPWFQVFSFISIIAGTSLIFFWSRLPPNSKSFFSTLYYWLLASIFGFIFPVIAFIRYALLRQTVDVFGIIYIGEAILVGVIALIGQIYHYSVFYYGRPSIWVGSLDPIGVGIPSQIRISCTRENALLLKNLGVAMNKKNVTEQLFLLDETDSNYIVAFDLLPNEHNHSGTLKIDKSLVKAILFIPVGRKV